ncbi:MAG: hypothetical protein HY513_01305 [Candidatus Aenigmarchaeota archaeon]|nr:hypothetical protein [Candidatus Aenigmarchaeota archaeon]
MVEQETVYAAVTESPRTSREIAKALNLTPHEIALPLRNLYESGHIQRRARTYEPYDADKSQFVYWVESS